MFSLRRFTLCLVTTLAVCLLFTQPAIAQKGKNQLTLSLSPNSVNAGGTVSGTVSHNASTGTPVTVSLSSSIESAVTMPASVTIDAGQSSTSFDVTAGTTPQSVTITASAGGYKSGSAGLTITAPSLVTYNVVWLGNFDDDSSYAVSANIHGEIVGLCLKMVDGVSVRVATRFTANGNGPVDLNVEMAELLADPSLGDGDWRAYWADGINDLGQIVGTVTKSTGSSRVYIYDPGYGVFGDEYYRERSLNILDRGDDISTMWSRGINNLGEIVGGYTVAATGNTVAFAASPVGGYALKDMGPYSNGLRINDFGQLALGTRRYTPPDSLDDDGFETFSFNLNSINAFGEVAGSLQQEVNKKGFKREFTYTVYRAKSPDLVDTIYHGTEGVGGVHINDHRDVAFDRGVGRLFLYRDGIGEIDIDTTVVDPEYPKWENSRLISCQKLMNPPQVDGNVGFPIIVGYAKFTSGVHEAFYLVPTVP